jgi:V8-like Glu-specific endopeptidase
MHKNTFRPINHRARVVSAGLLAAFIALQPALAQTEGAQQANAQNATLSIEIDDASQRASASALTRAVRRDTKTLEPAVVDAAVADAAVAEYEQQAGLSIAAVPGFSRAGLPDRKALKSAQLDFADDWKVDELANEDGPALDGVSGDAVTDDLQPIGTSAVYNRYYGNLYSEMWTKYPYQAIGKLYSTNSLTGGRSSCTASVISSKNVIVTAAHCVYDTVNNRWYTNMVFVPADRAGAAPYGVFPVRVATIFSAYASAPNFSAAIPYDIAVATLNNNSANRTVTSYTGWLGRSWDYGTVIAPHVVGYPGNVGGGSYSIFCTGESSAVSGLATNIAMGCDQTFGASGGPWIRAFQPYAAGAQNYVGAVNSFIRSSAPNNLYALRFTSGNIVVLCTNRC